MHYDFCVIFIRIPKTGLFYVELYMKLFKCLLNYLLCICYLSTPWFCRNLTYWQRLYFDRNSTKYTTPISFKRIKYFQILDFVPCTFHELFLFDLYLHCAYCVPYFSVIHLNYAFYFQFSSIKNYPNFI